MLFVPASPSGCGEGQGAECRARRTARGQPIAETAVAGGRRQPVPNGAGARKFKRWGCRRWRFCVVLVPASPSGCVQEQWAKCWAWRYARQQSILTSNSYPQFLPQFLPSILTSNPYLPLRRCFSSMSWRGALPACFSMFLAGLRKRRLPRRAHQQSILTRNSYPQFLPAILTRNSYLQFLPAILLCFYLGYACSLSPPLPQGVAKGGGQCAGHGALHDACQPLKFQRGRAAAHAQRGWGAQFQMLGG